MKLETRTQRDQRNGQSTSACTPLLNLTNRNRNVYADPEAAHIVFSSSIPIKFFPLDVTHQAIFRHSIETDLLQAQKSPLRETIASVVNFFASTYAQHFQFDQGPPVHDLLCVVYAVKPEIFEGKICPVDVELKDEGHRGRTVFNASGTETNVWMATSVDVSVVAL